MGKSTRKEDSRRRSRSRERESRQDSRKRGHKRREEEEGSSSGSDNELSPVKVSRRDKERESEAPSGSRQEEMSIEETNKLRISLGMKPLEVDGPSGSNETGDGIKPMETKEIFIKTENISEKNESEKIREKVSIQKDKRRIESKLKAIVPLGHESDSDEEAGAWVRKLDLRLAEKKARELEEMDEEIQRQEEERNKIAKQKLYSSKNLTGLTVGHSLDTIQTGTQVVLTLRDADLLDEDATEDILENVNILDQEKGAENVLNKKLGKRDYNPYDDADGQSLLSKYDETIDGKKKASFKLGTLSTEQEISLKLKKAQEEAESQGKILFSLTDSTAENPLKFASEYFTDEEMAKKKFRKPKRVPKASIRKRAVENEPEMLPEPSTSRNSDPDLASRKSRSKETEPELDFEADDENVALEEPKLPKISLMDIDEEPNEQGVDISGVVLEDDAQDELHAALEKARRLKERKAKSSVEQIASMIAIKREAEMDTEESGPSSSSGLGLNSLAEFCRNIGESSNIKVEYDSDMNDSDEEEESIINPIPRSDLKPLVRSSDPTIVSKPAKVSKTDRRKPGEWTEVKDMDTGNGSESDTELEPDRARGSQGVKAAPILGEEPDLTIGVAAALKLAKNKGYLESESGKKSVSKSSKLSAVNYLIDEKFAGGDDRGRGGRDRYSGRVSDFADKPGYNPQVNLEYIDDEGRILNEKEAFRQLSHKFHGKGPGKNKIDKRIKKLKQESKLRQMSSIDTPLNTVKKLQEKQKELQSPYVVISGTEISLIKKK